MRYLLTALAALMLIGCTENPFFDDGDATQKNIVTGRITLADDADYTGVYVWLEGLNIGALTSQDGRFLLRLPAPVTQPGGGYTGALNLYFYMGNYALDSTTLVLRNGEFLYSQGEINERGELRNTRILQKLADIKTISSPQIINEDYRGSLSVTVNVTARRDGIKLQTARSETLFFTRIFIQRTTGDTVIIKMLSAGEQTGELLLSRNESAMYNVSYPVSLNFLPPGEYEIIPYIWVDQNKLPRQLVESLDAPFKQFDMGFLKIPYRRISSTLTIIK